MKKFRESFIFGNSNHIKQRFTLTKSAASKLLESDRDVNFIVDGEPYTFEDFSLGFLGNTNTFRQIIVRIVVHPYFDYFILFVIVLNSIFYALADFSHVDAKDNLVMQGSLRNQIVLESAPVFLAVFVSESVLKIIAMGFIGLKGCYLGDKWHWLDLVVVITGIIVAVNPNSPNVSFLRTFRILRTLRTISTFPALHKIVMAILNSIPAISSVLALMGLSFVIFSIAGLQTMSGPFFRARCRATPFPVNMSWSPGDDYDLFRCLPGPNFDYPSQLPHMTKVSSPWFTPQDCMWPLAQREYPAIRPCSLSGQGMYRCVVSSPNVNSSLWSWCGSNYDGLGNPRFFDTRGDRSTIYVPDLDYGFMNFDSFAMALFNIFNAITMSGWTQIMYMVMDACNGPWGACFYVTMVMMTSLFMLQLLLAVFQDSFHNPISHFAKDNLGGGANGGTYDGEAAPIRSLRKLHIPKSRKSVVQMMGTIMAFKNPGNARRKAVHLPALSMPECVKNQLTTEHICQSWTFLSGKIRAFMKYFNSSENRSAWRDDLKVLVKSDVFDFFSAFIIFLNFLVLTLDHYPSSTVFTNALDLTNTLFSIVFVIEMIVKLIGVGMIEYWQDEYFRFDGCVVIGSIILVGLSPPAMFQSNSTIPLYGAGIMSILRFIRLFRVIQLVLRIKHVKILLMRIVQTVCDLASFLVLFLLFVFIATIFGMQFFANLFRYDAQGYVITAINSEAWQNAPDTPRYTFDDFNSAFASVFQIISTENWTTILYNVWRSSGPIAVLFPCLIIVFGTYILTNLFLAILLSRFSTKSTSKGRLSVVVPASGIGAFVDSVRRRASTLLMPTMLPRLTIQNTVVPEQDEDKSSSSSSSSSESEGEQDSENHISDTNKPENIEPNNNLNLQKVGELQLEDFTEADELSSTTLGRNLSETQTLRKMEYGNKVNSEISSPNSDITYKSIGLQQATSTNASKNTTRPQTFMILAAAIKILCSASVEFCVYLKIRVLELAQSKKFETAIMVLIALSCIILAVDNPLGNPLDPSVEALRWVDLILTQIFMVEVCLKIFALGAWKTHDSYFRTYWNYLDFGVVIISEVALFSPVHMRLQSFKTLRGLRALRPLRMISRAPGLKVLVNAIIASIPDVLNVFFICILIFSLFAIVAVNGLKGDLRSCQGAAFNDIINNNATFVHLLTHPVPYTSMTEWQQALFQPGSPVTSLDTSCQAWLPSLNKLTSKDICLCWGGVWSPVFYETYDNFPQAVMSFFQLSTLEGWVDNMYACVDSAGVNMQPIRGNHPEYIYFFILFVLLSNFLALNLFIGVLLDNFQQQKIHHTDRRFLLLSPDQQEWVKTREYAKKLRPVRKLIRPTDRIGAYLFDLIAHPTFDNIVVGCILANSFVLALPVWDSTDTYRQTLDNVNVGFALVFTIEAIIKITALRTQYFWKGWNVFDFLVVTGSDISMVLYWVTGNRSGFVVTLGRIFRIFRVLRLIRRFNKATHMMDTLAAALPGMMNSFALLALFIFIYSVMGVQLFAKIQFNQSYDVHCNFRTFGYAFLAMFRFATGEAWDVFMFDASAHLPGCVIDPPYNPNQCGFSNHAGCEPLNGCGSSLMFPFMLSYSFFISMCLLNLFVGVIIEGFQNANPQDKTVKPADYESFTEHWATFDTHACGFIHFNQLEDFLTTLEEPLGFKSKKMKRIEILKAMNELDIIVYTQGRVHFQDLISALTSAMVARVKGGKFDVLDLSDDNNNNNINNEQQGSGHTPSFTAGRVAPSLASQALANHRGESFTCKHYFAAQKLARALSRNMRVKRHAASIENTNKIIQIESGVEQ